MNLFSVKTTRIDTQCHVDITFLWQPIVASPCDWALPSYGCAMINYNIDCKISCLPIKINLLLLKYRWMGDQIKTKQNIKQIGPSSEHCFKNFMGTLLWNDKFSV